MGQTAELVARRYNVTREQQDLYSLQSQQRTARAQADGLFSDEIVPVVIPQKKGDPVVVEKDEFARGNDVTLEQLAKLPPAFKPDGTVTAGNSSGINDGAAALLLMERGTAENLGCQPLARVVASAVAGCDPSYMGLGPVPAVQKVLGRAGLQIGDIDLFEINEAFAAQSIPCIRELDIDPARVNVNGGSIAIGHPLGSTGARITATLLHEMRRRGSRYGLVTLCIGVGQGIATVFERA
jgi:acetyl-CoA acetyltransferase family protein